MAVDYEEGRRLLARHAMYRVEASERDLAEWFLDNAEALLNPDPWRPIEELPEEWKDGRRVLLAFWLHNKPNTEYCVVAASWIEGEGWMIDEETQWYPYPPTHFRELKGPGHASS